MRVRVRIMIGVAPIHYRKRVPECPCFSHNHDGLGKGLRNHRVRCVFDDRPLLWCCQLGRIERVLHRIADHTYLACLHACSPRSAHYAALAGLSPVRGYSISSTEGHVPSPMDSEKVIRAGSYLYANFTSQLHCLSTNFPLRT